MMQSGPVDEMAAVAMQRKLDPLIAEAAHPDRSGRLQLMFSSL